MREHLSFDDVLIIPKFSLIKSRKDVDPYSGFTLPIISSNMDSVTGPAMAKAMAESHSVGCLHRFCSIEENVKMFKEACSPEGKPWVSIGLGESELKRAIALREAGAETFVIDVAHGACSEVVKQTIELNDWVGFFGKIVVGNFATADSIHAFEKALGCTDIVWAYKVGIGGGSACLTRVVTGCGMPTLASIMDCKKAGVKIIADGGIRNSGDFCKAIAAGADYVMLGGMLAGTDESPGELITDLDLPGAPMLISSNYVTKKFKKYRGSASKESYVVQNKISEWRTAEGDSFLVPFKGPVGQVIQNLEAGLRSAMSYVGASTIKEFQERAEFIRITSAGIAENKAHGKSN